MVTDVVESRDLLHWLLDNDQPRGYGDSYWPWQGIADHPSYNQLGARIATWGRQHDVIQLGARSQV
uniref:Uncharacterized protein n=1 Tax=Arundo donax TaxID=35708 RepID=A0A0A9BT83_ARUDO